MRLKQLATCIFAALLVFIPANAWAAIDNGESSQNYVNQLSYQEYLVEQSEYESQLPPGEFEDGSADLASYYSSKGERTTSTKPEYDERIAHLFVVKDGHTVTCTASYVGGKMWITARHCFMSEGEKPGELPATSSLYNGWLVQSTTGDVAGIERVYFHGPNEDVALVKAGPGIKARPFVVAGRGLFEGGYFQLTGYSSHIDRSGEQIAHDYPSTTWYRGVGSSRYVTSDSDWPHQKGLHVIWNSSRACYGDSGGPYWNKKWIFGIHSGRNAKQGVKYCQKFDEARGESTDRYYTWIKKLVRDETGSTPEERYAAFSSKEVGEHYRMITLPDGGSSNSGSANWGST